jgi:hypothetical protein
LAVACFTATTQQTERQDDKNADEKFVRQNVTDPSTGRVHHLLTPFFNNRSTRFQYRAFQKTLNADTKTSSQVKVSIVSNDKISAKRQEPLETEIKLVETIPKKIMGKILKEDIKIIFTG